MIQPYVVFTILQFALHFTFRGCRFSFFVQILVHEDKVRTYSGIVRSKHTNGNTDSTVHNNVGAVSLKNRWSYFAISTLDGHIIHRARPIPC